MVTRSKRSEEGGPIPATYMAPTWSWASLEGAVALDLLSDNVLREVKWQRLVSLIKATVNRVRSGSLGGHSNAITGVLEIAGPLCKVSEVRFNGIN